MANGHRLLLGKVDDLHQGSKDGEPRLTGLAAERWLEAIGADGRPNAAAGLFGAAAMRRLRS